MRWIIAAVTVMLSAPAWAEEVLYYSDTDAIGFSWDKGLSKGQRTTFDKERFVVKVISPTEREITATVGARKGWKRLYSCKRPLADWATTKDEVTRRLSRQIACDIDSVEQWTFHDNTFVRVGIGGYPAGDPLDTPGDSYSFVAYGTCVKY